MALTTAEKVADYILCYAQRNKLKITNLMLQKLVYYAQAWFLVNYDEPLFDEHFEAWVHGPVQPELYKKFKSFSWKPIETPKQCPKLDEEVKSQIDEVMKVYGKLSTYDLECIVHHEDPWLKARGNIPIDEASTTKISEQDMKEYYLKISDHSNSR